MPRVKSADVSAYGVLALTIGERKAEDWRGYLSLA